MSRGGLLAGVSALALFAASAQVSAKPLGGYASSPSAAAVAAAQAQQAEAQRSAQAAQNALKRATQAVQAIQASQQAARDAARAALGNVPNGLQAGGLQVAPGAVAGSTLWQGANLPTEATDNGRTKVTVQQTQQKAILNWQTFNVGKETDLYFDQRAGGTKASEWIALNRVLDPSTAPSRILGSIKADGQVYVINRNGIIFGGASQVNVATLVASSLSLTDQQFMAGINTDIVVSRGLAGYIHLPQFGDYNPNLPDSQKSATDPSQPASFMPTRVPGNVVVEAGADVAAAGGGKVMLFAPKVINNGMVSAQDGQVIMAAGEQVYLRTNGSTQPDVPLVVRGLDVAVTAPMPWLFNYDHLMGAINGAPLYSEQPYGDSVRDIILPWMYQRAATVGYQVVNNGIVEANHGNITVMARDIVQNGLVSASTALNNRDGSIRLLAYSNGMMAQSGSFDTALLYWRTGSLHLMPGSVTSAMPDLSDVSEIELSALSTRYKPGRVELRGNLIDIQSQANIIVPAGTISVFATSAEQLLDVPVRGQTPLNDGSRLYIGEDAYLSVAGLKDIAIAMERNFVEAELRINELRDSVLYRDSWLRGQKIVVDRRESGVFTDGPMAGVSWGGADGAWIGTPLADVSGYIGVSKTDLAELSTVGGSIFLSSSGSLITRQGSLLDVSGGSVRYSDGWNATTKLRGADGRIYDIADATPDQIYIGFASGFTRGNAHQNITQTWTSLLRPSRYLEKGYTEGRAAGAIQMYAAEGIVLEGGYWGGVIVGERQAATGKYARAGSLKFGGSSDDDRRWLIDKLFITSDPVLLSKDFTATTPLASSWYSPAANTTLLPERTTYLDSKALNASSLDKIELYVSDDVTLTHGTTLDLKPGSTFSVLANSVDSFRQDYRIDGVIRAPGGAVNLLNAESVRFSADATVDVSGQWINEVTNGVAALAPLVGGGSIKVANAQFALGAVLDVSGGGWLKVRKGKVQVQAGDAGAIDLLSIDLVELAKADLRGYSAVSGGSLSLNVNSSLQIGGDAPASPNTVRLSETLFADRGFQAVRLATGGDITVAMGVTIAQRARSIDVSDAIKFASGTSIADMGSLVERPLSERIKIEPTSLSLTGRNVTVEAGAAIEADVGGSIELAATSTLTGAVTIAGRLEAPAGKIDIAGGTVTLKDTGALLARGVPVIATVAGGLRDGVVRGGGTVALSGTLALQAGSLIDVSGARGEIDMRVRGPLGSHPTEVIALASNGGGIALPGSGLVESTLRAQAGGEGARGGTLNLSSTTSTILSETATAQSGLILRPSILQAAGFNDLVLSSSTIRLDGVDLAVAGSISISGSLVNGNGKSSRLAAPYISLFSPLAASPTRGGTLTLAASVIDIKQAYIRGFEQALLEAADIRLTPTALGQQALLDVDGTLILNAGQIYPTSQTVAVVKATDKIIVQQNGVAGLALSVGGSLTLDAPIIEQGGTVRAPFGQITLKASQRLTLGAGSLTSVSGDGLILPYGNLSNNEIWTIVTAASQPATTLSNLPEKRITLDAPTVDLAAGSVVDIHGGGDLHAWEHVPGPGGSYDVLSRPGVYAIVPLLNSAVGASDAGLRTGDRIWINGGNGLAAGWYALLPAHYALLPGAYAIQMVSGSQGKPVLSSTLIDGSQIVSGYRANGLDGSRDQLSSAWRVMSGAVLRQYSEYNEAFANTFFASDAFKLTQYRLTGQQVVTPRLPVDGGAVVFKATLDLILNGQLRSQAAAGGRGGLVDIAAEKIAIVGPDQDAGTLRANGYLVIGSTALSNFGAGSLLIGGVRSGDTAGLRVDVTADDIIVRNNSASALTGPEIILAATDTIDVGAGSVIAARGEAPSGAGDLVMTPQASPVINDNGTPNNPNDDFVQTPARDWGALIRVSNGDVVRVRRTNADTTVGGQVTVGAGAVLDGGKALLIDATGNTTVTQAKLSGAALSLAAGRVGFGGGSGLVIDAAALAAFANTQHLTLRSYSTIDFFRGIDLSGLNAVTFDAAALVGYGMDRIDVVGNRLVLENTASTFSEPTGVGHGSLALTAAELAFGEGAKALRGFDTVTLVGTTRIVGESNGSLDAGAAAVAVSTPVLTGRGGASQSMTTTGDLSVATNGSAAPRDLDSLGARWSLTGRSVAFGGRIDALGGAVDLTATNGDVVLAVGALIDVGGFGKPFFDVAEYANAGRIALRAIDGSVLLNAGATLDLGSARDADGRPLGGGAGTLAIASDGSQVVLDGTIMAKATAGQRGASFDLDIATLPSFSALSQRLNEAGFSKSRSFRVRSGDVTVDGSIVSEEFSLSADQGVVTLAGAIDARARYGGMIAIYGGQGLVMTSAATLRAGATDTVDYLGSGRMTLGITGGSLAIQGGLIDVGGGEGGKVTLRAPVIEQPGADTVNVSYAGTIAGAREIVLEGYKRFDLAALAANSNYVGVTINGNGQAELDLAATAAGKLNVLADYGSGTLVEFVRDFDISAAYGALGGLASQANFHARPGMELNYAGDIVLKSNWNLGAGIVNQSSAITAGVMAVDPAVGKAYVIAGRESELLRDHTTMVYRTGGSIFGEAGVLTLRAEGDIELKGSITDGFFQFANPLDPTYLQVKGTVSSDTTVVFNGGRSNTSQNLTAYNGTATGLPQYYAGITFWRGSSSGGVKVTETKTTPPTIAGIPYSAEANSPAANSGNSLAYATMFPSITKADGSTVAVSSWSQTLVAGAAPRGESADPARLAAGSAGKIILSEQPGYSYYDSFASVVARGFVDDGTFSVSGSPTGAIGNMNTWIADLKAAAGTRVNDNSSAVITIGVPSDKAYNFMLDLWNDYAADKGLALQTDYRLYSTGAAGANGQTEQRLNVITKFSVFADFFDSKVKPNLDTLARLYPSITPGTTGGTITPSTVVRTGTGDINIVARGDLQLKGGASVYTAGRRDLAVFNDFTTAPASATYGVGGGHLRIDVGGSIDVALPTDRSQMQHYTEWLKRQGIVDSSYVFASVTPVGQPTRAAEQSSWWVDYNNFKRGIGALGGGNVDIDAGGDLNNLTVAVPTNGRVRGGRTANEQKTFELRNGGAMTVEAGGAVRAGYYYIGRGAGEIEAGEFAIGREVKVTNGIQLVASYPIAPIVSVGDATLDVRTAGNLRLQTALDPLMVGNGDLYPFSFMSSHTDRTALSLTSAGGDVVLVGQVDYLSKDLNIALGNGNGGLATMNNYAGNIYPSKLRITALNGSVINNILYTMPSSSPELRIIASGDVLPGSIVMSRATPAMIPSPFEPVAGSTVVAINLGNMGTGMYDLLLNNISGGAPGTPHALHLYYLRNPAHLPNENDYEPSRIYALNGSIVGTNVTMGGSTTTSGIMTSEQTWFRAGTDIRNINYFLRNIHTTDVSVIEAGNDIIGGPIRGSIAIQGPGALLVSAGRDVYAPELSIMSTGNRQYDTNNRPIDLSQIMGLPDKSAAITVMAGLGGKRPSYEALQAAYLDPANLASMPDYLKTTLADGTVVPIYFVDAFEPRKSGQMHEIRSGLVSFVAEVTGETLAPQDAWSRFQSLPALTRERFLRQVYMQELREAGKDQNEPGTGGLPRNGGYNRGYAAIETLFPGQEWKGNVTIGNALFRTMAGGDIEVLTPGGGLQVAALGKVAPAGYGLVTLGYGDVNIFTHENVTVNRSRILTFVGGDEIIWSTVGDIDAGRGAKTTRVPSAPEVMTDVDAVTRVLEKADISGSGIGTIVGFSGVQEGDVHLIAPQGTVNAGDAGVRVSGNLNVAARFVLNAANFDVAGEVKGMPPVKGAVTGSLKLESNDAGKATADATKAAQPGPAAQPSVIIVEVLGFGGGGDKDEDRRSEQQGRHDPNGMFRVLGNGQFSAEQIKDLTEDEKRELETQLRRAR